MDDTSYSAPTARPGSAESDKLRRDVAAMDVQIEQVRRLTVDTLNASERDELEQEMLRLELQHKQVRRATDLCPRAWTCVYV